MSMSIVSSISCCRQLPEGLIFPPCGRHRISLAKQWLYGDVPKMVISLQLRYLCWER
jgi:hypothetical protein